MSKRLFPFKLTPGLLGRLALVLAVMVLCLLIPLVLHPIGFLKAAAIVEGDGSLPALSSESALPVAELVSRIPYQTSVQPIQSVHPERQFRQAVLQGKGNCADMAWGLGYDLNARAIDFQVIHILPQDKVLEGWGHVVLRLPYRLSSESRVGLIDIYEGSLVTVDGLPADVEALRKAVPEQVGLHKLPSRRQDVRLTNYQAVLPGSVLGYTPGSQVARMQVITEKIYIPMGNERLEQAVYLAIALIGGYYPEIRLLSEETAFVPSVRREMQFYRFCLWGLRVCLGLLVLVGIVALGCTVNRGKNTG